MSHENLIAGYRILARIGSGAASELFAAQDRKTKQVWALKHVIKRVEKDQRFIDQVQQEYIVGSKLNHRNIRSIHRFVKHRSLFKVTAVSLLMELIDGSSLEQHPPKNHLEIVRLFHKVALGLTHMHLRGFVHADIKPSNILVTDDKQIKIIDLGQGCPIGTVKARIQGTPGYMAPEQAHRQAITPKTDIYNLGATMYWVLVHEVIPTSLPPKDELESLYTGALDTELVKAPTPPHEKDPAIHPILSKQILDCVQLHPDDRPESMSVVANRLELVAELLETSNSAKKKKRSGETPRNLSK